MDDAVWSSKTYSKSSSLAEKSCLTLQHLFCLSMTRIYAVDGGFISSPTLLYNIEINFQHSSFHIRNGRWKFPTKDHKCEKYEKLFHVMTSLWLGATKLWDTIIFIKFVSPVRNLKEVMSSTHSDLNKMAGILQTAFPKAYSWMKSTHVLIQNWINRSLFLRGQLTISQHWFT